ncbi:uncharacterized protein LOC123556660 [Mercenaria mercenaria]|uniref:uncharacterized protein LOC123556660 n=1 Tax=Mercenaria mercenaria TaxID=6596 RepID=UPI00234EE756|nr:uncharacterized protein LOC123556660 [Mercenaria mercenaria]XP_053398897.1 uncharacterized protein LOC123556660 [Mercenaria mercenaria]
MAEMADDHVPNFSSENVAMKPMNAEARADTSHLLLRELEYAVSLVGPAKEEITKLQLELKRHQVIPERTGSENVVEMQYQLENAKRECKDLQKQLKDDKYKNETQYNDLLADLQNANAKIHELEILKKSVREQEENMRAHHKEEIDAYKEVNQSNEMLLQSALKKVKQSEEFQQRQEQDFTNDIRKQQQQIAKLTASLQNLKLEKDKLEKSLSDTQSRLSKLMGDKLSDNNPDIADLSDNNRPTKLAEKYQELYDNQWTDAYEVAEDYFPDKSEHYRIKVLLQILMKVYSHCAQEIKRQDKELLQAMYRTSSIEKTSQDLPVTMKSLLKEIKRLAAPDAIGNLTEGYLQDYTKTSFGEFNLKVKDFVRECITICWLMVCQEPPLVFHLNVQKGEQFDNNKYKHYTLTGTVIDYVVWPALLLHQEGSVLCKGVVQCTKSIQGSKSVKVRSRQVDAAGIGIPTGSVRLTSSETPIDTTKWYSDGNFNVLCNTTDLSSTDTDNTNNSGQKQTQSNESITNPPDQRKFASKETNNSADTKGLKSKLQQPARMNEQPSRNQDPSQHSGNSTEKTKNDHKTNQPLNQYRSEAKVHLHTTKHGGISQHQSSVEHSPDSKYDNFQQKQPTAASIYQQSQPATRNKNQSQPSPTADKKYQNLHAVNTNRDTNPEAVSYHQNQNAAGNYQQNPHAANSYQQSQHVASNSFHDQPVAGSFLQNQPAAGSYQQNQPAAGSYQQNQPAAGSYQQNQPAAGSYQQNQPAAGSYQQNQPAAGSYQQNQPAACSYQQKQPAVGSYQQNQPAAGSYQQSPQNASFNGSTQYPTQQYSGSHQQNQTKFSQFPQSSSSNDQGIYQPLPYNFQTSTAQYPAHLIPTKEEYDSFIWYSYTNPYSARSFMGAQLYDKCSNYVAWLRYRIPNSNV